MDKRLTCLICLVAAAALACQVKETGTESPEQVEEVFELICSDTGIPSKGGSVKITVFCDKECTLSLSDDSWGSITKDQWTDGLGGSFIFSAGENCSPVERINTVHISTGTKEGDIPVTQEKGNAVYGITVPGVYQLDGLDYSLGATTQFSRIFNTDNTLTLRVLEPETMSVIQAAGLPLNAAGGKTAEIGLLKISEGDAEYENSVSCTVKKVSAEGTVWVYCPYYECFIVY